MNQALQIGDTCPAFSLPDSQGKQVEIASYLGKKILVIFFYPKDDTPGCTKEACAFRDAYADFLDLGCEVFGISSDSSDSHAAFQNKHNLPYPLLSDQQKKVRQLFGVPGNLFGLIPGRVSYVVDLDSKIAGIFNSQTNPVGHIDEAIKVVKNLLTA
ncbi:MAG: peroxiredoxin [Flavobacteriales bacterium]